MFLISPMNKDTREELEDTREDVLRKAFAMAGLAAQPLPENSEASEETACFLKKTLHLDPTAFLTMNDSIPAQILPAGLTRHILPFHNWTLNIWTIETDKGIIAIDTGTSPEQLRSATSPLSPAAILITHLHHDHVGGITAFPDTPIYSPENIRPGMSPEITGLRWNILDLAGHTPTGIGWLTEYKNHTLFFPGDSIFARSIGKCEGNERLAMTNIIHAMNTLPPETLICPGHGPATTVKDEWRLNPFIAPYKSR